MDKIYIIERFTEHLKNNDKSSATITSYGSDLYLFSQWFEKANHEIIKANKITPTDLRQYKAYLIDYPMKPQTINRKINVIKIFINWLLETDRIKNRFPMPKPVKESITAPKWLDKNQQHFMMRHLERYGNERDKAIVKILLNTGLRVSELADLKWSEVRMTDKKGAITIRNSKANRYRDIPLNKDARSGFLVLGYENHKDESIPVVEGQRGYLNSRGIQLLLKRRFEYTELDFISPHLLRHTFCKNLVDAGVGLEKIALLAGHESLDTTRLYCQPSFDDLTDSVEKIGEEE